MISSMFSGVSGLRAHQLKLDVIGNNIANVNTTAYKSSAVTFQEVFSQTIQSASQPTESATGGTNPQQVGLGVSVANISTSQEQGSIQSTDNPNDLAIDGDGYFIVYDGVTNNYTRAGNFSLDEDGNFVTSSGSKVMGWNKIGKDEIDLSVPISPINLSSISMPANATEEITIEGNIDSSTEIYDSATDENYFTYKIGIYDSLGESHSLTFKFMKDSENEYSYEIVESDSTMDINTGSTGGSIVFDATGEISETTSPVKPAINITFTNGAAAIDITSDNLVFSEGDFTQYSNTTILSGSQDGYTSGTVSSLSIDSAGGIMGTFTNGKQEEVATIALANFINPSGLEKVGDNQYSATWNSGDPEIGVAGSDNIGQIISSSLEMSNVDLSEEFTQMIIAQRGFQANSRVITTSDELLEELVNLKR